MAFLYVTEQGAVLRRSGDRLVVTKKGEDLISVPAFKVEAVLLFGGVQVTTQALQKLLGEGKECAFLTRTGRLVGQITSPFTKNIELRVAQFDRYRDEAFRLDFAKRIVAAKVSNGLALVRSYSYNHPEAGLDEEKSALDAFRREADGARDLSSLRGLEGAAAKSYFSAFGKMLLKGRSFPGRRRRPPKDPANSLLSLGYTMVFNEISSLFDGMGFDPYLGYFHAPDYGRPSLAADIVEEFRSSVDRFTLYLLNNGVLGEGDFEPSPKGGLYLTREGLKRYLREYDKRVTRGFHHPGTGENTTLRKCFRIQGERVARCIRGDEPYRPFLMER